MSVPPLSANSAAYSCSRSPSPGPNSAPLVSVTTFNPPLLAPETAHEHPPRKLCVRHPCMADEGTNLKLQQALDALSVAKRKAVSAVWSSFSSSSHPRCTLFQGLLTRCCFSQLFLLTEQLVQLICVDPFAISPREVSLKILGHLDVASLWCCHLKSSH
ncbi:hypothetical protein C8Q78DRAFT_995624 [Trametes maxima]|nr:hypothetical protein C8Q78DRAFT_995624 [Trametes maxima]